MLHVESFLLGLCLGGLIMSIPVFLIGRWYIHRLIERLLKGR